MYQWMTLLILGLLTINQATFIEGYGCPMYATECSGKASLISRSYRSEVTYKDCLAHNLKAAKIRAECRNEVAKTAIAQKACSCGPSYIASGLRETKEVSYRAMSYCNGMKTDVMLPTCHTRVRQCFPILSVSTLRKKLFPEVSRRERIPSGQIDAIFTKCPQTQKTVVDVTRKCFEDMKSKDLSACGSLTLMKDYVPLASALSKFLCSGCNIYRLVLSCRPPMTISDVCKFILDDSKTNRFLGCLQEKLSSDTNCSSVGVDLISTMKEFKQTTQIFKVGMHFCRVQSEVQEEYESWGCFKGKGKGQIKSMKRSTSTKRDTPTKEQREMDGINKEAEVQDSIKREREMDEFYMEDRKAKKSNKEEREMDESNMEGKEMDDSNILDLMADLYQ